MIQNERVADWTFAASATSAGVSWWLSALGDVLTLAAAGIAIVSGLAAALFHYEGWRERRRLRLEREADEVGQDSGV